MNTLHRVSVSTVALLVGLGTMPALAQEATTTNTQSSDAGNLVQGDISAENSIKQGLKSGALSPEEATRLEAHQARIDKIESRDLRDGQLSNHEQNRIDNAELREGSRIVALDNNDVTADPNSKASIHLANDVQRDVNQEQRMDKGLDNDSLTPTDAGKLEAGQAKLDRDEFHAARNGFVSDAEQQRIRTAENGQSMNIRDDRHNNVTRTGDNDRDDTRMSVNHVRANNDGSLTYLDSNSRKDRDQERHHHERVADRDNGRDFDRDNHHESSDHFSKDHDHDDFNRVSGDRDRRFDQDKDFHDRDDHFHDRDDRITNAQNGDTNNYYQDRGLNRDKDHHDRDDHLTTTQNGDTNNHDQDNRIQTWNGDRDKNGHHDRMMINQASSNDSSAVNANSNTGANANTGTNSTTNNSVTTNTRSDVGKKTGTSINGTLNGQSVTANNAPTHSMARTTGTSSMHAAVTTPHVTPHMTPHPTVTQMGHHH